MRRNNSLSLLLFVLSISCSKNEGSKTLINIWEKKVVSTTSTERKLASLKGGRCLKNQFTIETLRDQVKELESKFAGVQKIEGKWRHLNLSSLSVPQANFLKKYGDQIGDLANPESIDYSGCDDVPCVFNKIYGKENDIAGYVHYLWFLKFGHMLSADNDIPVELTEVPGRPGIYNDKNHPLSAYLYNKKELYGFWRLSLMLKPPHTNLQNLREIQRIPRGEDFEEEEYKGSCGLAYSLGWIKLNDGCLTIYENDDLGHLYEAVTHELSHMVDFEQGKLIYKSTYRSDQLDYLNLVGMSMKEHVDVNLERKWNLDSKNNLITAYAGTNPAENFAESVSYFRTKGQLTKEKLTSKHFEFISRDYYESLSFDDFSLMNKWIKSNVPEIEKQILKAGIDCSNNLDSSFSNYFRKSDLNNYSDKDMPGLIQCLGKKAEDISSYLTREVKVREPEGCLLLENSKITKKWDDHVKSHLVISFNKFLAEIKKDKNYVARVREFYGQVTDKQFARESLVECYGEEKEEECYYTEFRRRAYDRVLELNLPEHQSREIVSLYLSYHPYLFTKEETTTLYRSFVDVHEDLISKESSELWRICSSIEQNDQETPTGSLFLISNGYMISSFYNCLNAQFPNTLKEIVRKVSVDGVRVQNSKEELILSSMARSILTNKLNSIYEAQKKIELLEAQKFISEDQGNLRNLLLSDFSWLYDIMNSEKLLIGCRNEVLKNILFKPLFHLKKELFSDFAEGNICSGILSSVEFKKWKENSKDLVLEKIIKSIHVKVITLATGVAEKCVARYPVDTAMNRMKFKVVREKCLTMEWPSIEENVLFEMERNSMFSEFQISKVQIRDELASKRRILQLRVMKESFN